MALRTRRQVAGPGTPAGRVTPRWHPRPVLERERPYSRRDRRPYLPERLPLREQMALREAPRSAAAQLLTDAGALSSTLRAALRERGIDPKLARLVLCFDGLRPVRVAEVAWRLAVSPSTASRWCDRAERFGLVDKLYFEYDRRGTWVRTTSAGRALAGQAQAIADSFPTTQRPAGWAYGRRATPRLVL